VLAVCRLQPCEEDAVKRELCEKRDHLQNLCRQLPLHIRLYSETRRNNNEVPEIEESKEEETFREP